MPVQSLQLDHQLAREHQARAEAGRTAIGRATALALGAVFLGMILSVPAVQFLAGPRPTATASRLARQSFAEIRHATPPVPTAIGRLMTVNRIVLQGSQQFEDDLEDESVLGQWLRPRLQSFFASRLGIGSEQVYVGRRRTLYYRPDLDTVTGPGFLDHARLIARARGGEAFDEAPQPDPRPAIRAFHQALAARGIRLILMPVPGKATVDPHGFTFRRLPEDARPHNIDFERFVAEMEENGIAVFRMPAADPPNEPNGRSHAYLLRDTHWQPQTMRNAARALAAFIGEQIDLPPVAAPAWIFSPTTITAVGDLTQMLDLPPGQTGFPAETVTIEQVLTGDGQFWRVDEQADVLLLGDSFSNIYSFEPLGWGESAGLAEHLGVALQRPVDRMIRNDAGAHATRTMLAAELARGHDRLAGKLVLIWQFSERELAHGHWPPIALELGEPQPSRFVTPTPGETLEIQGTVQAVAAAPRPGTVPYRDHVIGLHLIDLQHPSETVAGGQAMVYLYSMRDNQWTRAARLRRGETVRLRLTAWETVADLVETINRAELDDWQLQLESPCWGEFMED